MVSHRADTLDTRRRLLDAAAALFAERGFRGVKTADICRAAGANGAAVNYHFGGKQALYMAAWRHTFDRSTAAHPPDGGVPADAPPEDRLRGHIRALVRRSLDPLNRDLAIADQELSSPTGLLTEVIRRSIEPLRRMLSDIVRALLAPGATRQHVQLCELSIHAQCVAGLKRIRSRCAGRSGPHAPGPSPLEIGWEDLADHVIRFSLAGIYAIRRAARKGAP